MDYHPVVATYQLSWIEIFMSEVKIERMMGQLMAQSIHFILSTAKDDQ